MSATQQTKTEPGGRLIRLCQWVDCMREAAFEHGLVNLEIGDELVDWGYACREHLPPMSVERVARALAMAPPPTG